MNLAPRDRLAIRLGAAALAIVALVWLGLMPWLESWADARDRVDRSANELQVLQDQIEHLSQLRLRLATAYGPGVQKPPGKLETVRVDFVKQVMDALAGGGFQVRGLQPQGAQPLRDVPGVCLVSCQVQAIGQFPQLAQVLANLRSGETLIMVERINATPGPQGPGTLSLTMVLSTLAVQEAGR